MLHLLLSHQGSALDLLGGLQCSADPLPISSCLWYEKMPSDFYKLSLEHKNGGMRKCLEKPLYRSLSKDSFEFENFLSHFEKVLSDITSYNSLFTIILGDFNARSSVWWTRDKTIIEGTQLESLTTVHGFHQLISKPTHLLPNAILHCFNITFIHDAKITAYELNKNLQKIAE